MKIAGTGSSEAELHALQAELQADIEFLGFKSGVSLHELIREARAVVLPSEWYESAPMSVLESFAFGKPVVGACIGGIPEMIEEGISGWGFASGDEVELTEVLGRVRDMSSATLFQVGRSARELVVSRFNRENYVSEMLALYVSLGVKV